MGLLSDFTAYVDSLKRRGANTAREFAADPMGLLGRNVSAFSESLPAAPGEPPNEMLARPGMQDWATGVAMNAPTMGLLGHTVYHGSPHKFDKFDASKIGTGEGAQAYGHGLYFAESPEVARSYAPAKLKIDVDLSRVSKEMDGGNSAAYAAILDNNGSVEKARASLVKQAAILRRDAKLKPSDADAFLMKAKWRDQGVDLIDQGIYNTSPSGASLYKADLPDEWLPKMLDWDKPLSQQPKEIQEAVRRAREAAGKSNEYWRPGNIVGGRHDYGMLGDSARAAALLREQGVPGIRYKDGGSRGTDGGTHNYVVFPGMEHLLKILERE